MFGTHSADGYQGAYPDQGPRWNYPHVRNSNQALPTDWYYGGSAPSSEFGGYHYYDRYNSTPRQLQPFVGSTGKSGGQYVYTGPSAPVGFLRGSGAFGYQY